MKKIINILSNRNEYCLLVKRAFDNDFCDRIIKEKKDSFKKAKTHYPTSYRNNERQVLDTEELSNQLFQEIKNYIPEEIEIKGINREEHGKWKLDSLNSRIRICRYLPNQYFNKHLDGVHYISATKQSKLTFMIYLNGHEDFVGGRTLFFNSKQDDTILESYKPEKGDLIIFDHNLWHSGEEVLNGEKYILRSDIIYQKIEGVEHLEKGFCGEGHLGYIWTATMIDDKLITSGRDKKIKIWSKEGIKISEILGHRNSILNLIAFDKNTIISASRDTKIKIWKRTKDDNLQLNKELSYHEGAVLSLCKINENDFFSGGADGILNQINVSGELVRNCKAHNEWIWDITKIDSNYYATISEDGAVKVWKYDSLEQVAIWKEKVPINSIITEDKIILLGRLDGIIIKLKFDALNKSLSELVRKKCHDGIIRRLSIDDNFIYSASEDNTLKVWTKEKLNFIELFEHKNFVQDIALIEDSIISVSYDGEINKKKKPVGNRVARNND